MEDHILKTARIVTRAFKAEEIAPELWLKIMSSLEGGLKPGEGWVMSELLEGESK